MVHVPLAHRPQSSTYSKSTNSHQRRALAKRKARLTTTTHSPHNTSSSSRIIIADDHDLVRESTRSLLDSEPDLRIIDEAKDGQETIELCRLQRPDLVIMDVGMHTVNGLEATRTIKEELPTTKVLIWSAYEDRVLVSDAVRAGADGYVLKLSPVQELVDAIRGCLEASLDTLEVRRRSLVLSAAR
jgi:DNA-binding NarL/FixJ family response regulator